MREVAVCVVLAAFVGCANWPANDDTPADAGKLLENSLPVAAAALAAGQLGVARRLYLSLSERFDDAPEPFLGLGYIALQSGNLDAAESGFKEAAKRATEKPALRAEALLGAGRTALARDRPGRAARHFRDARAPAQGTPFAAWTENGLAVAATLKGDHEEAEAHYVEALRLSSDNPRIAANYIRMLVAAGRSGDAGRTFERFPATHWPDDEQVALPRLIADARRRAATSEGGQAGRASPALASGEGREGRPDPTTTSGGSRAGHTGPAPALGTGADPARRPGSGLGRDRVLWLYLSDARPAPEGADPRADADAAPADRTGLMLQLAGEVRSGAPHGAGQDAALTSTVVSSGAGTALPARGDPSAATQPGAESPAMALQSKTESRTGATPPDTRALASDPAAPRPAPAAPGSGSVAAGTIPSSPGLDPGAPGFESPDHASPPTVALILGQSRRIHLEHDATTVLVAAPEVADVQLLAPDMLYVIGKGVGRTSVTVLQDDERIEERVIAVTLDLEPLRATLAGESDLAGVRTRRLARGVALTGEVASAASVDRALRLAAGTLPEGVSIENELRVAAPQQVNLEVQIAEVHRSVTEDLGVNWEWFRIRGDGSGAVGFRIGRIIDGFPPTQIEGQLAPSVRFGRTAARSRIGAMIDALSTAGLANVLARPNVTAVSGESASFFSGGERPIPSGYDNRTNTILFEYKKVGVLLDFVPTVVDSGRIVLTVRPEVSEPDASQPLVIGPVLLPVINVRRAETTVEVGDGESIVIAGLFRNQSSTTEAGLPGIKDVPLLGLLFGTTSIRSNELELIVIVTARLVRPNAASDETGPPPETLQVNGYHY